nr:sperm-activating peptide d [Glyptocidaris crenularis]
SFKLCPGGQCV